MAIASGQTLGIGTRPCMYCMFIPNGWNRKTTGAGVRASAFGTRTTKVRIASPTLRSICPDGPGVPLHVSAAALDPPINSITTPAITARSPVHQRIGRGSRRCQPERIAGGDRRPLQ